MAACNTDTTNQQPQQTIRTTVRTTVQNLATTGSLPMTWPLDKGFPTGTDNIWSTSTLAQCILENNTVVTPLLVLGSCQGKLHLLAGPNYLQFITFDKSSARDLVTTRKPALTAIITLARDIFKGTTTQMFLPRRQLVETGIPLIMPLTASLLHNYLLARHPAQILIAIKDEPNSTG